MFRFERGLRPRNRVLGEASEGAAEAPSDRTPQMGPYHRSSPRIAGLPAPLALNRREFVHLAACGAGIVNHSTWLSLLGKVHFAPIRAITRTRVVCPRCSTCCWPSS